MANDFSTDSGPEDRVGGEPTPAGEESPDENLSGLPPEVLQETELPGEYKPYSQFPWDKIPEEARPDLLKAVKQFHGDMSRGQSELGELRRRSAELEGKALTLDRLLADPAFIQWHESRFSPPQAPAASRQYEAAPSSKLQETFGADAVAELQGLLGRLIDERIGPIHQRLEYTQREQVAERTERDMRSLDARVRENGWLPVANVFPRMVQLMQQGRAKTPEDAYRLAAGDDLLKVERERGAREKYEALRKKAASSFSPGVAAPAHEDVRVNGGGDSDTIRAMQAAAKELGISL